MTEREVAPDDRREQMLRAAVEVIAERGFPETRIADIGKRVGASSALVIYYFGTKDRLLTEALRYSEDQFYTEVAAQLAVTVGAQSKLELLVRHSCTNEQTNGLPGSWILWLDLWAQAIRHPEVSRDREELDARWRAQIEAVVAQGQSSGEFIAIDAARFALLFSSLLDGLVVQVALGDPQVTAQVALELSMGLAGRELGFDWKPARISAKRGRLASVRSVRK